MIGSIIGGALGAIGGIMGTDAKSDAVNRQGRALQQMQRENQDWYNRRYKEDPTQRADTMRVLSTVEDAILRRNKAAEGTRAVMGGGEEAVAAAKEANARAMADATAQVVAANERRKDAIEEQYLNKKSAIDNANLELEGQKVGIGDYISGALGGMANGMSLGSSLGILDTIGKGKKEE